MAKKITIITMIFLIGILFVNPVFAQNEEVDPGVTPDQGILWELDMFMEKLQIMFTFKQEEKASLGLLRANERLAEMKVMADQNKIQFMNRAETERNIIINEIERNAEGLSEEHRERIREGLQKHIEVLERVREKAPEQAHKGLESAINKSSYVLERIKFRENETETSFKRIFRPEIE